VTIYSEMLRLALAREAAHGDADPPVAELVAELLSRRTRVTRASLGLVTGKVADRVGDSVSYDVALVKLCTRLGIDHNLTGDEAGPDERQRTEERLIDRLPSLAGALNSGPDE
jgi:hypothetical protein